MTKGAIPEEIKKKKFKRLELKTIKWIKIMMSRPADGRGRCLVSVYGAFILILGFVRVWRDVFKFIEFLFELLFVFHNILTLPMPCVSCV